MSEWLLGAIVGGLILTAGAVWHTAFSAKQFRELQILGALQVPTLKSVLPAFRRELNRARRFDRDLTVAVFELNERDRRHGKTSREDRALLRMVYLCAGSMFHEAMREHDIVACDVLTDRYFTLLVGADKTQAKCLVQRVIDTVEARTHLRLRAGVAQFQDAALTIEDLLERAADDCQARRPEHHRASGGHVAMTPQRAPMIRVHRRISDRS